LLGVLDTTEDQKRFNILKNLITTGFQGTRWALAESKIGDAQTLAWAALSNIKEKQQANAQTLVAKMTVHLPN
jgi:hypothetical protein